MMFVFSLIVFLFTIMFPSSLVAETQTYPVIWTAKIKIKSLAEIPKLINNQNYPESTVQYINDRNERAVAKTCKDYFEIVKKGYYPANNMEMATESFFKLNCDSMVALLHAKPASLTYLRSFNLNNDYKELPAALIFPNLGDGKQPTGTLDSNFPDTTVENKSSNSITLVSKKAGMKTVVEILGWGDFDNNNIDEMLVFVANYVLDGTYRSYTTAVLRKNALKGPIQARTLP